MVYETGMFSELPEVMTFTAPAASMEDEKPIPREISSHHSKEIIEGWAGGK